MSAPIETEAIRAEIAAFLAAHHTVCLATVDADGNAHAANLLYALDGLGLLWTSDARSRHSLHLAQGRAVAATIAPDYDDFRAIRGVQIHGNARRLTDASDIDRARAALCTRYPFLDRLAQGPEALQKAWRDAGFFRLDPTRVTLIDNTRGFGHKDALVIGPDGSLAVARSG